MTDFLLNVAESLIVGLISAGAVWLKARTTVQKSHRAQMGYLKSIHRAVVPELNATPAEAVKADDTGRAEQHRSYSGSLGSGNGS
jgi:hypothetical protein